MKKLKYLFISLIAFVPIAAKAVCPVCTVAVCASVGLSRWLGVDDTITGLWIGGVAVSVSIWTIDWLSRKQIRFFGRKPLVFFAYYGMTIWPLYHFELAGHPFNKLWGYDKLMLGIVIGSIVFSLGAILNEYLKKRNGGRVYFPFQRVVLPVGALAIASLIFYFICDIYTKLS